MSYQILNLVRPFVPFLPDVKAPGRQVYFQDKLVWTTVALLIFLVASQVPLFGILSSDQADPFYWMRMMMASNRGTLMDLGISPIITSGMILQALTNTELITVNFSIKEDRILYDAAQKLVALIMTFGQAVVQVVTGFYGNPKAMGVPICILLVIQLMFSGIIIILLDEMLSKGYGMGSGVNLFIATNVCESIIWKAFSPKVYHTARGFEFEGCIVALVHSMAVRKHKLNAIYEIFFRKNLPNLMTIFCTILIFCVVIYFHGMRVELPVESTQVKGSTGKWPIKLFYSSTTPIIVQSYIVSHTSTISRFLYDHFPHYFLVRMLGVWEITDNSKYEPISGLCYYIYPPESLMAAFKRPLYFTVYMSFMLISSALLSRAWIDIGDLNEKAVAKQMKNQKLTLKGMREDRIPKELSNYIPTAGFLGGFIIGMVCVFSNILDTIGSGTNIILAVSIIWQYFELFCKENVKKGKFGF